MTSFVSLADRKQQGHFHLNPMNKKEIPAETDEYKKALEILRPLLPKSYLEMLKAHYLQPQQTITASELAQAGGYQTFTAANLHYGKLGKRILNALRDYKPSLRESNQRPQWTMVIAEGTINKKSSEKWTWKLRPQVSEALDQLGWFTQSNLVNELNNMVLEDLHQFEKEPDTKELKKINKTQYEALRQSRIGQGVFRQDLLHYWGNKCAVTEVENQCLLRASHIKPWRDANNQERLDRFNGLLLQPNLDAAFDACLISFTAHGHILISDAINQEDRARLGIKPDMKLSKIEDAHLPYLAYHRDMFNRKPK